MQVVLTYIALFFGIFLEGELVFLSAVIAAHHGYLNLWLVILVVFLSTIIADTIYFYIGRKKASAYIKKGKWASKLESIQRKFEKHRIKTLLGYRFIYGFRAIAPIFLGTQSIAFKEFFKYCVLGTLIWVGLFTCLGLLFGELILNYLKHIEKAEHYSIAGLLIVALLFVLFNRFRKKNSE